MKTPKIVIEGVYNIPYQGFLRFGVKLENDELVFTDGDKKFHDYFGNHMTTSQYSEKPERHPLFDVILSTIKRFVEGKERTIEIPVDFTCMLFGEKVEATGACKLHRFYN